MDDIQPSTRKYPFISFKPEREPGNDILFVEGLTKTIDGVKVLDEVSFVVSREDKIAFTADNDFAVTTLFQILMGELEADAGSFKWGVTMTKAYFPRDNSSYFEDSNLNLIEWLRQFSEEKAESYIRGFFGKMLFSGEEPLKNVKVLSGGEKVRCMLARMMQQNANILLLDQPTNHLDLESITALNNGLNDYKSNILIASHDHQLLQTVANRVISIKEKGIIDKRCTFDEFIEMM